MKTKEFENLDEKGKIMASLYARKNYLNGKYTACNFGIDNSAYDNKGTFYLKTLRMKADLADKLIAEAESQGKNTEDLKILKEIGEKINAAGTPINISEAVAPAIMASLELIAFYGIAVGIWGLVLKQSFLTFGFWGVIAGFLVSLLFVGPVIASQRTKEQVNKMLYGAGSMWGQTAIIIGVLGLIALAVRLIFFR